MLGLENNSFTLVLYFNYIKLNTSTRAGFACKVKFESLERYQTEHYYKYLRRIFDTYFMFYVASKITREKLLQKCAATDFCVSDPVEVTFEAPELAEGQLDIGETFPELVIQL